MRINTGDDSKSLYGSAMFSLCLGQNTGYIYSHASPLVWNCPRQESGPLIALLAPEPLWRGEFEGQ